jgi:PEGA domain
MRWIAAQCAIVLAGVLLAQGQGTSAPSGQQPAQANQQQTAPSQAGKQTANPGPGNGTAAIDNGKPSHKWHVKLGTVSVGAGYTYISSPFFDPFFPFGFFGPGVFYPAYFYGPYDPFYGSYLPGLAYGDDKGKVELAVLPKSADVYLDGAYAGPAGNLKKIWLNPGAYDLTVSTPGGAPFHERIYVLSGKSLKITHNLLAQNVQDKQ